MGLLDDAIREHLELKRQHGADPQEVSRQEQEALGAPRRAEFAKSEGQQSETAEPEAGEAPPEERAPEPFDVDTLDEREDEPEPHPEAKTEPEAAEPPPEPAASEEDPWLAEERDEVPPGESLEPPRPAEPESGEDVLEETPDFLQETPEHDRLWFEQRPPRDFDWDK